MALRKVSTDRVTLPPDARRILYVEDEDQNWEVAQASLGHRHTIVRARTAQEAAHALNQERFDLIFMDIQLADSELDGIGLTRLLKGRAVEAVPAWAPGLP